MGFIFDYGAIVYKHRFSIKRALDDYSETVLDKCISISTEHIYKTMARDKLVCNIVIIYRKEDGNTDCLKLDIHDWTISIKKMGDMKVQL